MFNALQTVLSAFVPLLCGAALHAAQAPFATKALVGREFEIDKPVTIPTQSGTRVRPAIAHNGQVYLAVWVFSADGEYNSLVGARVSEAGQILDQGGIAISPTDVYVRVRAVASSGTNFFAVWDYGESLLGARISGDGTVLDRPGIPIGPSGSWNGVSSVEIAASTNGYLVVVSQRSASGRFRVVATRVSQAGRVLDPDGIVIRSGEATFAVASVEGNYLVAWNEPSSDGRIVGKRISANGEILDETPLFLSQEGAGSAPSIAGSQGEYFVIWQTDATIRANRISANGQIQLAQDLTVIPGPGQPPSIAVSGDGYLLIWEANEGEDGSHVYGARVDRSGTALDPAAFLIGSGSISTKNPAVASDGDDFLVVWETWPTEWTSLIFGTQVSFENGGPAATNSIQVSRAVNSQDGPAVASNGTNYFVVWNDWREQYAVFGGRVSLAGEPLDGNAVRISPPDFPAFRPTVASCAGNYLVVWQGSKFAAMRVSPSGEVLNNEPIVISTAPGWQLNPQVAANGRNYLVVWEQRVSPDVYTYGEIYGALIAPDGRILKTDIPICTAPGLQQQPAVAAHGDQFLVVWDDPRDVGIRRARISGDGVVLDPDGIAIASATTESQYSPQVSATPDGYLVLWEQFGDSLQPAAVRVGLNGDVLGQPVTLASRGRVPAASSAETESLAIWGAGSNWENSTGMLVKSGDALETSESFVINSYIGISSPRLAYGGNGGFLAVSQSEATSRIVGNSIWLVEPPTAQILRTPNGETSLSWPSQAGRVYRVEVTSDLNAATWEALPGEISGTGQVITVTDASSAPQQFYRILVDVKPQ